MFDIGKKKTLNSETENIPFMCFGLAVSLESCIGNILIYLTNIYLKLYNYQEQVVKTIMKLRHNSRCRLTSVFILFLLASMTRERHAHPIENPEHVSTELPANT